MARTGWKKVEGECPSHTPIFQQTRWSALDLNTMDVNVHCRIRRANCRMRVTHVDHSGCLSARVGVSWTEEEELFRLFVSHWYLLAFLCVLECCPPCQKPSFVAQGRGLKQCTRTMVGIGCFNTWSITSTFASGTSPLHKCCVWKQASGWFPDEPRGAGNLIRHLSQRRKLRTHRTHRSQGINRNVRGFVE